MCFSAVASFASGAILIPAGVYCLTAALRKAPKLWPLAIVPIMFGIQQISEGVVWHALDHNHRELVRPASLVFLFFALALWPFWFAFISAICDSRPKARMLFACLAIISISWFFILYYPLITGPHSLLDTRIVHHSIFYDFTGLAIYEYIPNYILRIPYFLCVALPMAFADGTIGKLPGIVFGLTAVVAAVVFSYAFVSVWCFMAALLSGYLVWHFYTLKQQ